MKGFGARPIFEVCGLAERGKTQNILALRPLHCEPTPFETFPVRAEAGPCGHYGSRPTARREHRRATNLVLR
jgi:hypothetical protein